MIKAKRVCQNCGKPFDGSGDTHYCRSCADTLKRNVIAERVCIDCGIKFHGGPKAIRCPDCREYARTHKKQGKAKRPIGSVDHCCICGNPYIVTHGKQKYCGEDCARIGLLQYQKKRKKIYNKSESVQKQRREVRKNQSKLCKYCNAPFLINKSNLYYCSDYCRSEYQKIIQCRADMKQGKKRDLDKYLQKQREYQKTQESIN